MRRLILPILFSMFLFSAATKGEEQAMNVCELLKSAKRYDGKVVLVFGLIHAGAHSHGISSGEGCFRGVAISYAIDSMPQGFVDAVTDKRLGLNRWPLKVSVKGRFQRRVPGPQFGYVSRIDVSKALSWEFVGEKATASSPVNKPQ